MSIIALSYFHHYDRAFQPDLSRYLQPWISWVADGAIASDQPFVGSHFTQSHWSACMHFLGADTNFGTKAELCTVGESGRSIGVHRRGIDSPKELIYRVLVFGNDGFTVL